LEKTLNCAIDSDSQLPIGVSARSCDVNMPQLEVMYEETFCGKGKHSENIGGPV